MKSVVIVDADPLKLHFREFLDTAKLRQGFWGVKLGDAVLEHGMHKVLRPLAKHVNVFIDLKHFDTRDRVERIVDAYAALGEYAPRLLTISGDVDKSTLQAAVDARGYIEILVTGPLSNWSDKHAHDAYSMGVADLMRTRIDRSVEAGAQGVTCPAWLLDNEGVAADIAHAQTCMHGAFTIIATGVRSKSAERHNHAQPRTLRFAYEHGASLVVVGREITQAQDPIAALDTLTNIS